MPRAFRSLVPWSTPFLNTDQNAPVSPWVTTWSRIGSAFSAPERALAAAGAPSVVSAAAPMPPLTRRPRREKRSSSVFSSTSSFICCVSFRRGLELSDSLTRRGCDATYFGDGDRAILGERAVGGDRDLEGGAGFAEVAGARRSAARGVYEGRELGAVGGCEAVHEVAVARVCGRRRAGLERAERRSRIDADRDAVV